MLRFDLAVGPDQFSRTGTQDILHRDPIIRRSAKHHLRRPLHSDMNIDCIVTAIRGPWNGSHSEYSVSVPFLRFRNHPDVRCACLDRPCLVTTAALTTSSAYQQTLHRFPLSTSCWLGWQMQDLLSEFQDRCVVLSPMQPLQRCLSVAADVTPVHQVCSNFNQPAQHPCGTGFWSSRDAPAQRSVFWPGWPRVPLHVR